MIKVSIIIPNYNHGKFLEQRLSSVLNQTYQDFEVIILDDASTDGSVEIIKQYKHHPKVSQIIINTENSGSPFKQWKRGIELAKGEYIWVAESDDYNSENFLEESIKYFKQIDETGLVFSKIILINEWGEEIEEKMPLANGIHNGTDLLYSSFGSGNLIVNGSSVVFKKSSIVKKLNELQEFQICGDWFLWNSIASEGKIVFTDTAVSYYRKHTLATTDDLFKNPLFYKEAFKIISRFKRSTKLSKDVFRIWLYRINHNIEDKSIRKALIKELSGLFGINGLILYFKTKTGGLFKRMKHKARQFYA